MIDIESAKKVFILGIKGVGMAQLAIILHKMGKVVVGVDVPEKFITDDELKSYQITIVENFDISSLPSDSDLVVYSAAHGGTNNPIIKEAIKRGFKTVSQGALLGFLVTMFEKSIAVCGSHGKTTTSSLLSYALIKLGVKPSYFTGSSGFNDYPAGDYDSTSYFIVEADEYGVNPPQDKTPKFLQLNPSFSLCTNIDFDHPDIFANLEEVKSSYETFFKQSEYNVVCADSEPAIEVIIKSGVQFVSFGFAEDATYRIINHQATSLGSKFDLISGDKVISDIHLSLHGDHNIVNAAGVVVVLLKLGFIEKNIKKAVRDFVGAKRRFEVVYNEKGITIVDDYAHHPEEIKAVIKAAAERWGTKPIVIFQPHTYSRTQALLEEFAGSFVGSKHAYILPIFASARENVSDFIVTHKDIVIKAKERGFDSIESLSGTDDLCSKLASTPIPCVIMTLGAGDVYKLHSDIIRALNRP